MVYYVNTNIEVFKNLTQNIFPSCSELLIIYITFSLTIIKQ